MRVFKICLCVLMVSAMASQSNSSIKIDLPKPQPRSAILQIIQKRSSQRSFLSRALTKQEIADLLYAAYGSKVDAVTSATKTVPSAGAIYPLEIYLVVGLSGVEGIAEGVYSYLDTDNALSLIRNGDVRKQLMQASLAQEFILEAPVSIVIAARYSRTKGHYGERGGRYVDMEAGHSCQNIYLVATHLGLSTVEIGAFSDIDVKEVLNLQQDSQPLAIMPIGYPK